jgi:transposase, IS30 family
MTMIDQRPAEAAGRTQPGHWEGDLITGASNRSAIGTLVDRASRYTILVHLPGRHTAEAVRDALITALPSLPQQLRRSLTWDQGKEIALHAEITAALGMPVYFCEKPARGSGHRTRTPTGCCASTSPRAATCACTARTSWPPSQPS